MPATLVSLTELTIFPVSIKFLITTFSGLGSTVENKAAVSNAMAVLKNNMSKEELEIVVDKRSAESIFNHFHK